MVDTTNDYGTDGLPIDAPAAYADVVVPSDTVDLPKTSRSLYVGVAGDVVLDLRGGQTAVKFVGVPAGQLLPVRAVRVRATGTTASSILSLR